MKVLVGVWATDTDHYNAEKAALLQAIRKHGTRWIAAVSVGSEDLYWNTLPPAQLASQINEVRGMVRRFDRNIKVGPLVLPQSSTFCMFSSNLTPFSGRPRRYLDGVGRQRQRCCGPRL
jgi:exo-beta-1,3-glucanase (GH17 family)